MKKIKIGEPQPVDCNNCQSKEGYQYSDFMKLHYTIFHDSKGKYESGTYSDGCTMLNKAVTVYCINCGKKLKFKLIRENFEILK